jgi:hypothetical protein
MKDYLCKVIIESADNNIDLSYLDLQTLVDDFCYIHNNKINLSTKRSPKEVLKITDESILFDILKRQIKKKFFTSHELSILHIDKDNDLFKEVAELIKEFKDDDDDDFQNDKPNQIVNNIENNDLNNTTRTYSIKKFKSYLDENLLVDYKQGDLVYISNNILVIQKNQKTIKAKKNTKTRHTFELEGIVQEVLTSTTMVVNMLKDYPDFNIKKGVSYTVNPNMCLKAQK